MHRQARHVRVGHTVAYEGEALRVAVVKHPQGGPVRIISVSGDALEVAPTEQLDFVGGPIT